VLGRYAPGIRRASGPVPVIADVGKMGIRAENEDKVTQNIQ